MLGSSTSPLICLPHLFTSATLFFYHQLSLSLSLSVFPLTPASTFFPLAPSLLPLFSPPVLMEELREWAHLLCLWRLSDPTGLKVPFSVSLIEGRLQTLFPVHLEPNHPFTVVHTAFDWATGVHTVHTELDLCQSCFLVFTQGTWVPQWGLRGSMLPGL